MRKMLSLVWILAVMAGAAAPLAASPPPKAPSAVKPVFVSRVTAWMPSALSNPAVVNFEGRMVCMGGNNERGACALARDWDPVSRQWKELPPMREARFGHAAARVGNRILVFGGMQAGRMVTRIEALDMTTRTWSDSGTLPFSRSRFGLAILGQRIWMAGGSDETGRVATLHVFDPTRGRWERKADLPDARDRLALVALEGHLYALGGEGKDGRALATVFRYSPRDDRWTPAPSLRVARKNFAAERLGRYLVVAGGWNVKDDQRVFLPAIEAFDPARQEWTAIATLETPRDGCRAVAAHGRLFCFGGFNGSVLGSIEEMRWVSRGPRWRIDEALKFHLAWFSSRPPAAPAVLETQPPVGYAKPTEADITNINLKAIRGLGFPLPEGSEAEKHTFYLKFYEYPTSLDHGRSTRRLLDPLLMYDTSGGGALAEFLRPRTSVLVKKGVIERTDVGFGPGHPFPPMAVPREAVTEGQTPVTPQDALDRDVVFSSLYVRPLQDVEGAGPAAARESAGGVLAVHQELLSLYGQAFIPALGPENAVYHYFVDGSEATGVGAPARVTVFRIPRAPMVFEKYQDLPMPQDPKRIFLSGLLLVYRDDYELPASPTWYDARDVKALLLAPARPVGASVFEVGSVLRLDKD